MSSQPTIVTLDGPAGVGKTTLAKGLAAHLGLAYLDTGAMYRTVAWVLGAQAAQWPEDKLKAELEALVFSVSGSGPDTVLHVNGRAIGDEIRSEEVAAAASVVARLPQVRLFLSTAQRAMGQAASLVAEGRDMGTVVFPGARAKFFLTAKPEIRARRRVDQLEAMGQEADYDAILAQIVERDERDATRTEAPLKPADDAILVDTSELDAAGVLAVLKEQLAAKVS